MLRYCANCKKEYDFLPLAVSGKDDLICPECGHIIDKNSRRPTESGDQIEEGLGQAVEKTVWFNDHFPISVYFPVCYGNA